MNTISYFSALRLTLVCLLSLIAVISPSARADDSSAAIGAGGLEFTKNSNIVMTSEDLYLSKNEVRIRFRFTNTSSKNIKEVVAFPLPDLNMGDLSHTEIELPANVVNFVGFSVSVDGVDIDPKVELKAYVDRYKFTRNGLDFTRAITRRVDVTDLLRSVLSAGGPAAMMNGPISKKTIAEAKTRGVDIVWDDGSPAWTLGTKFYWTQTFPAGRSVIIEHRYNPIVGSSQGFAWDYHPKDFCPSDTVLTDERIELPQAHAKVSPEIAGRSDELRYILTTGANWSGPIRDFKLTIDAEDPDVFVASCFPGLHRIGPTEYGFEQKDYTPDQDIRVLFGTLWDRDPSGPYLIPTSDSLPIDAGDLGAHSSEFLKVARNEIYARHGYEFNDPGLRAWFSSRDWYHSKAGAITLSSVEKANVALLLSEELRRSSKVVGSTPAQ